jgi:hypothetical protein
MSKHFVTIDDLIRDFSNNKITGIQFKTWYDLTLRDPNVDKEDAEKKTQTLLAQVAEAMEKSAINKHYLSQYEELLTAFKFKLNPEKPTKTDTPENHKHDKVTAIIEVPVDSEKESLLHSKITQYGSTDNDVEQRPEKSICAKLCEQVREIFIGRKL